MFAHGNRIWVVITNGVKTRICSSQDGMTTRITPPIPHLESNHLDDRDLVACKAWFKAEGQLRLSQNPRSQHVLYLGQLLLEAAREKAYDGLIVIATERAASELNEALAPETRALLMGQIIRDIAASEPIMPCPPAEMRH